MMMTLTGGNDEMHEKYFCRKLELYQFLCIVPLNFVIYTSISAIAHLLRGKLNCCLF